MTEELCHCGKPLHYSDETVKKHICDLIKELGTHVQIVCEGKTYRVPRHYIALHGINGKDLDKLGFEV